MKRHKKHLTIKTNADSTNTTTNTTQENIKTNPAEFWKFANLKGGIEKYPDGMNYGDTITNSTEDIVTLFADYFESLYVPDEELGFRRYIPIRVHSMLSGFKDKSSLI